MADVTKSVKKSGGDYSTVMGAVDAYATQADTGWYKCEIQDSEEYDEYLDINESVSSPSITHYIWVTAASANRHSGVAGTGHARIKGSGARAMRLSDAYTRIDWLQVDAGATTNQYGIHVNADNVLVSYCIFDGTTSTHATGRGISIDNAGITDLNVDNCVIYEWASGVWLRGFADTITAFVDHCTIWNCGPNATSGREAAVKQVVLSSSILTLDVYNTIGCDTVTETDFADGTTGTDRGVPVSTSATWNGTHNLHTSDLTDIDGTDNTTNWQDASSGGATVTTTTASAVIFADLTTVDLTLVEATGGGSNLADANGTDRQGSEPDSRQDFSVDIAGNARPTSGVDIGAFQIQAAATGSLPPFRRTPRRVLLTR